MKQFFFLAFAIVGGIFAGYQFTDDTKLTLQNERLKDEVRVVSNEVNSSVPLRSISSIQRLSSQRKPIFHGIISKNKLQSHHMELSKYFPTIDMGGALLEYTVLIEWQQNPAEAIETLSYVFDKLPAQYSNERQQLIQHASKLETDKEDKLKLVFTE
jgi:hypothetical protein